MGDSTISGQKGHLVQVARVRSNGWTKARRKAFLQALASTCNIRAAESAAGMSRGCAYKLRARDPAFAELWRDALMRGYERLEEALLRRALIGVNAIDLDEEGETPGAEGASVGALSSPEEVRMALSLLNNHRARAEGRVSPRGGRKHASDEETDAALAKQLDAVARRLGKGK